MDVLELLKQQIDKCVPKDFGEWFIDGVGDDTLIIKSVNSNKLLQVKISVMKVTPFAW